MALGQHLLVDDLARVRWERSLRELEQEAQAAGRAWQRAGGYLPVDGTPPSQPELFERARKPQERYHAAAAECYPPDLKQMLLSVQDGDRRAIAEAIDWLEADYFTRWTGYMKQQVMHRLCQAPLTDDDKKRLRAMVLAVCTRGPRLEFRELRKLARRQLATPAFAAQLQELAASADTERTRDAALMVLSAVAAAQ